MSLICLPLAWLGGFCLLRFLFPAPLRWSIHNVLLVSIGAGVGKQQPTLDRAIGHVVRAAVLDRAPQFPHGLILPYGEALPKGRVKRDRVPFSSGGGR